MELSANWKKLKATLSAAAPKKESPTESVRERKFLKQKQHPSQLSKTGKRPRLAGMTSYEENAERINEGLSQKYIALPVPAE
jgi:hypothetical protein